jgi:hypothetical protein
MPIILPDDNKIDNNIHNIIEQIKLNTYFDFFNFMNKYASLPNIVFESLPAWYIKITKKCNDCNVYMDISEFDNDRKLYNCPKCNKKYNFNIYDIDNIYYKFKKLLDIL